MADATRRYDIEPLLRVCNGSQDLLAEALGMNRRTVVRWVAEGGVPEPSADSAAVRIGRHPGDLWSEWWDYPVTS